MSEADPLLERLSEDFAAEQGSDDAAHLERAVAGALEHELPSVRPRRRWPFFLAAAALFVGAAAAARMFASTPPTQGATVPAEPAPAARAPEPKPEPVVAVESLAVEPEPAKHAEPSAKPAPSASPTSAPELFARANAARRAKSYDEAIRLYRELQQRYPDSREAQASRVTLGQLLLDHTDAKQALGEFDGYLAKSGGTVSEEALVGRARSLDKLGKQTEARAAWQELLRRYPSSVHAAEARSKLAKP